MSIRYKETAKGEPRWVVSIHQGGRTVLRRSLPSKHEAMSLERKAQELLNSQGSLSTLKAKQTKSQSITLKQLYLQALSHPKGWKYASNAQPANAEQVIQYLGPSRTFESLTNDDLMGFINHCLIKRGNSPKTVNKKLYALQTIADLGISMGLFKPEDTLAPKGFALQENNGGRTRILSDSEIQCFESELTKCSPEEQVYLSTLLHMGMRPHELWSLTNEDFNPQSMSLRILRGKKRGARNETYLPIPTAIRQLWSGLNINKTKLFEVVSSNHKSLALMQAVKQRMGIKDYHLPANERVTPYTLRHTCCTRMIRAGVPIYTVKEWMGHNSIETTLKYAHFSPEMFCSALQTIDKNL